MRYLVNYEPKDPALGGQRVYAHLATLNAQHVLASQWVLRQPDTSAHALRDDFLEVLDDEDRLVVVCLDHPDWATYQAGYEINQI